MVTEQSLRERMQGSSNNHIYLDESFDDFVIEGPTTVLPSIDFTKCGFGKVKFSHCEFNEPIKFEECTFQCLIFERCSFRDTITLTQCSIQQDLFFRGCEVEGLNILTFDYTRFYLHLIGVCKYVVLMQSGKQGKKMEICLAADVESTAIFADLKADIIEFTFGRNIPELKIIEVISRLFSIKHLILKKGDLAILGDISTSNFHMANCQNDGNLTIKGLKGRPVIDHFMVYSSFMGKCILNNVDIYNSSNVKINDSFMLDMLPTNVKWNFDYKSYQFQEAYRLRELFRQLKVVCSKNMDKVSFLRFEMMEMHFYRKMLNWRKDFFDRLILESNRVTNSYGQNYWKPFVWLIGVSAFLYLLINFSYGHFGNYHIGRFFSFVLPFHDIKDVLGLSKAKADAITLGGGIIIIDVLQKILSSYLIFQFLRAFRKFVKF